ncbi:hypothetical protein ACFVFJ_48675 [Streptomyces sp. NPDC057717]|uniref:hypothetical protein n=1 Tax=unclassified Streptomyces TaxID=2593676 RepID=UPI0036270FF8
MALAPKVIQNQDSAAADTRLAAIAKALGYHDKAATRLVTEAGGPGADTPLAAMKGADD